MEKMLMKATAIATTLPLPYLVEQGIRTPEDLLVYVARVSNPTNQLNTETGAGLIKYCLRKAHWSVFETNYVTMEIETTRDIGRQLLRHQFKFSELSQRYADPRQTTGFVLREARLQDEKNRQNSIVTEDADLQIEWSMRQQAVINLADEAYQWALDNKMAKECARVVLPEGNTISRLYATGPLRNWITYIALREKNGTQKEHMELAKACKKEIVTLFPVIGDALGIDTDWIV
jgi:thymidylate synthase (FAD)